MKIVQICQYKVPVSGYGGIERVIYWLSGALANLGHEVVLIAPRGSFHTNDNVCIIECDLFDNFAEYIPNDADIVHIHNVNHIEQVREYNWLLTIHGYSKKEVFINNYPENIVGISHNHAISNNLKYFVYNGVDSSEFIYNPSSSDTYLFFSKVSYPAKGVHEAIKLANKCKINLEIYGGTRKKLLRNPCSFASSFRKNICVKGYAGGEKKAQAFAAAKALLFPIKFPEPFGLVMVEAMMSGTPVIAFNRGAVAEVIGNDGGFVVNTLVQMEKCIGIIDSVDRKKCRQYAIENFDISVCARNYVKQYERVLKTQALREISE